MKLIILLLLIPTMLNCLYVGGHVDLDATQNNSGVKVSLYSLTGDCLYSCETNYVGYYVVEIPDGAYVISYHKKFYQTYKMRTRILLNNTWLDNVILNGVGNESSRY